MTIRDREAFLASLPDWAILEGCFGFTTIRPTDVDGAVERCGFCLFLEHKGLGVEVKQGQHRMFQSLARQGNTCIVYWTAETLDDVRAIRIYTRDDPGPGTWDADLEDLRREVRVWYEKVNASEACRPHPFGGGDAL